MNFKIVIVVIGIILSMAYSAHSAGSGCGEGQMGIEAEVCGTDEITYNNQCALNEAAEKTTGLEIKHVGACKN